MLPRRTLQTIFILLLFLLSGFLLQGQTPGTNGTENWVKAPLASAQEEDPEEPPFEPLPPREYVKLELEVVTPDNINVGLGGNVNIVVKIHNRGNINAENVLVYVDGTNAYKAMSETVAQIKPDQHKM